MTKGKEIVLTGDRPTGRLHLGHYVGSIENRLKLQGEHELLFYMIADVQALTDNADNPEKVRANVLEVALDNLAVGMDSRKTVMFIQSQIPEIAELTVFFLNLVTISRLKQNPTVKTEIRQKGFGDNVPAGFLAYPVSQAADILAFKATSIPVGEDQLPVIEQANEIVDAFNRLYGATFSRIKPIVSKHARLMGIDGKAKMSKSLNNAIYLSDSQEDIERKVMMMYTDPKHIHASDPGEIKGNIVFNYLNIFDQRQDELDDLKKQYKKGGLGDIILKKRLQKILNEFLTPIREKRSSLANDPAYIMDILRDGTKKAREYSKKTMAEVREHMKINYY